MGEANRSEKAGGNKIAASLFYEGIKTGLFKPVDIASLVFFRIAFGLLMFCEVMRYFAHGWVERYWIRPQFLFTYYGFSWVHPWPGIGMYWHLGFVGVVGIFIALGFCYRISTVLLFLGITYWFLLEQANYLNHFYLVCLLSFLLIFVPANRAFAIATWWHPQLRADQIPAWSLWLFRGQMAIVYFYSGIAKISPDWLRGKPMDVALAETTDFPILGRFFREPWAAYVVSYGGLFLDLLAVPLLLWRRTRLAAFGVILAFHLINARLFQIGIFPWLAIAATSLFLSPDWPRRVLAFFRRSPGQSQSRVFACTAANKSLVLILISCYFAIQLLIPLRHWLYPGDVAWTFEGHLFSWRMKLVDRNGEAQFFVTDPNTDVTREVDPAKYLSPRQTWKMSAQPDMILQFAHFLARTEPCAGPEPLQVRAKVTLALNAREPAPLVDPDVDLAAERAALPPKRWILPMPESSPTR